MHNHKPFIHTFKVGGKDYIYDVNRNVILKGQNELIKMLMKDQAESENVEDKDIFELMVKMKNDGFFSSNRIKEILHPADELIEYYLNSKIQKITLQLTQNCNLNCSYCAYSGGYYNRTHTKSRMDFEIAKRSIDFLLGHSEDNKEINIGFYGGEPLLEKGLIRKCINYAKENCFGKKLSFTITTNGTLLNENIVQLFVENDVYLVISLDGPKEVQDKNRKFACTSKSTFEIVMRNVSFIKEKYPNYYKNICFNAVLDQENEFCCIDNFFRDFDLVKEAMVLASEINPNSKKEHVKNDQTFINNYKYEIFKLFLSRLGRLDQSYVSKLVKTYFISLEKTFAQLKLTEKLPEKAHHGGPCIPGSQRLFIDTLGNFYPCERVSETSEIMKIGNIFDGFNYDNIREILNIGKLSESKCKNCWAFRFCGLCVAMADSVNGLSRYEKVSKCNRTIKFAEDRLKDICMLKNLKYEFNKFIGGRNERKTIDISL
ncbi:Cys-rich peptide radical SAM maturase CcpM [Ruminiclostridium cellobioparum]|uniref:Arylsulfatase regulator (Fe-S oxidoreductase) n=1 Tax=Ruminiclostridium cellobioparum subsp. termitidis CT1112 TaxID=1195236 RepID=S0FN89_RUMCE|nr:Cys-rich peptide radical SAM maturase CcpM [Ruminiclostridium cellobioparum]EMS69943.1 Arylsulfatase regulator (Fe-S oxidoreductase) [Ruminiclostridium cellobioparum subsp. termitidis CT1112]